MARLEDIRVIDISGNPVARAQAVDLIDMHLEQISRLDYDGQDYFARQELEFLLGAYSMDRLVGMASAKLEERRDNPYRKNLLIRHVVADIQRHGVGTALVQKLELIAGIVGVQAVRLNPTDMEEFYEKLGYSPDPSTGSYYKYILEQF